MSDLIRRSALLADIRRGTEPYENGAYFKAMCDAKRIRTGLCQLVNKQPPVDAVEVVRCKDCEEYIPWLRGYICGRIGSYYGNTKPDDYCSRGVRKHENA